MGKESQMDKAANGGKSKSGTGRNNSTEPLTTSGGSNLNSTSSPVVESPTEQTSTTLTKREEIEKAYHKIYRSGVSLIGMVCNENAILQKRVDTMLNKRTPDVSKLTKEIKTLQSAELKEMTHKLATVQNQVETGNAAICKQFTDWKLDLTEKIERLLKLKTPCALTKVDMVNTIRKEYYDFRAAQKIMEEQRAKPITEADLKPLLDDIKVLHNKMDHMEESFNQTKKDNEATLEVIIKKLDAIHNELMAKDSSSSDSSTRGTPRNASPTHARRRSRSTSNQRRSRTPRRRSRDAEARPRRRGSYSRSRSPTNRTVLSSVHIPKEKRIRSPTADREFHRELQIRDELRLNMQELRDVNKALEEALKSTSEASKDRHEELLKEKKTILRRRDHLEMQREEIRRRASRKGKEHDERNNRGSRP